MGTLWFFQAKNKQWQTYTEQCSQKNKHMKSSTSETHTE